jgi:hypothetical protein
MTQKNDMTKQAGAYFSGTLVLLKNCLRLIVCEKE